MHTPAHGGSDPTVPQPHTTLPQPHTTAPQQAPSPQHAVDPQRPSPGRIGPYEVFQLLGEGGMGRVFLARSPGARLVALKVIRPEYAEAPNFRGRFKREADAARRVSGFYTPPVLDADADAHQPWLATAYIPAPSLHEVVRRFGVLPEPALRALGTGLAEALLAIHAVGIVHRDLKPGNVLVAEDGPRVIDFGISRAVDATQVTRTNAVIGTPGFMAPEQIVSSREAGPAADVFSLGCVLAFAGTGQGPFGTGNTAEILYRAVHAPPRLDGVPEGLRALITACLEKDPARRPAAGAVLTVLGSAEPAALLTPGLREDLARRAAHAAVLVAAPPLPPAPLDTAGPAGPSRRRFLGIAAAGGTAVAAGGAAALAWWPSAPRRTTAHGSGRVGSTGRSGPRVPAGPRPRWSTPLPPLQSARLRLLGETTLVRWDQRTAVGYDTATGERRWTAKPRVPSDASGEPDFIGVHGSTLFATAWSGERGYLLGLDGDGEPVFTHPVTKVREGSSGYADHIHDVFCVTGSVALLGTSGNEGYGVYAVDVATGKVLWSRTVHGSDFHAHAAGRTCFLHDADTVHGLDLRTGEVRWTVPKVLRPGDYPGITTDGDAFFVTSTKVRAFRATDGARLWTAVDEPTSLNPTAVRGRRAYLADGQSTVFALDTRSGEQLWHTASPLTLDPGGALDPGPSVTPSVVVLPLFTAVTPGFIVLRASDGEVLWAHQGAASKNKSEAWRVQTTGTAIYAASDTTLHAFRSDPR